MGNARCFCILSNLRIDLSSPLIRLPKNSFSLRLGGLIGEKFRL